MVTKTTATKAEMATKTGTLETGRQYFFAKIILVFWEGFLVGQDREKQIGWYSIGTSELASKQNPDNLQRSTTFNEISLVIQIPSFSQGSSQLLPTRAGKEPAISLLERSVSHSLARIY